VWSQENDERHDRHCGRACSAAVMKGSSSGARTMAVGGILERVMCFAEDAGFLLSNLRPESTGVVGAVIWLAAGEFSTNEAHVGPRILVVVGAELSIDSLAHGVAITLSRTATVVGTLPAEVRRKGLMFVEANRDLLLEYWRGEMDTWTVIQRIAPVRGG
jgi:hypothetical protein